MTRWREWLRRGRTALTAPMAGLIILAAATGPAGATGGVEIFVASNNWHTEIVLPRAAVDAGNIPELADLAPSPFVAFGWGDADYYPARTPGVEAALRAAFKATPAVLHVTPVTRDPKDFYRGFEVLSLERSPKQVAAVVAYVDGYFNRGDDGLARQTAPGLYRDSRFYAANGSFHALNTCNTWTAAGLMKADLPVGIKRPVYAEELMLQLRPLAAGVPQREEPKLYPFLPPSAPRGQP